MSIRCLVCDTNDAGRRFACSDCLNDLKRKLDEIYTYWTILTHQAFHEPTRGTAGRMSPGYGSRSPARDDVLVVLDIRSTGDIHGEDDTDQPLISIPVALDWMTRWARQATGLDNFLGDLVPHVALTSSITDLAHQIDRLHRQVRALAHDQPPRAIAPCMELGCTGVCYPEQKRDRPGRPAGARCDKCGRTYIGRDLLRLGAQDAQEAS